MRILSIRGRNLASLAHPFEVDFRLEPLASAGLFAITGATGAGKSTLLDALCLALYDDTPRLTRAAARGVDLPDVGKETIAPRDPRSILRRGAAEGFAEVDFVGNDGVGYRARWNVRRARSRPDGKLQPSEMSILRIADGHPMAGNLKTEVLPEIQRRIGLSFAQFTRAVLLAQNDFAAFLKASDDERAELLQTLTGTDLFSDISRRAFERNKSERERLQRQQEQLADHQPLDGEARARLEAERAGQQAGLQLLEKRKSDLESHLRWHEAWEQDKQLEAGARAAVDKAQADKAAAAGRQAAFALVEAVQSARPRVADVDHLTAELEGGRRALAQAEMAAAGAAKSREEAERRLREAGDQHQAAERARSAAQPELERARELDAQIRLLEPNQVAARKALDEAQATADKAGREHAAKAEEGRQSEARLEAARRWLAENTEIEALAAGWIRWETLLGQAAAALSDLTRSQAEGAALAKAEAEKQQAQEVAGKRQEAADREQAAAQEALEAATRKCAESDPEALAKRKKALETRRDLLMEAGQLWRNLATRQARHGQLEAKAGELARSIEASQQALAGAQTRKPAAEQEAAQAERSLRIAEAACHDGVEKLRETLEADTPCPVCGSRSHPYATGDSRLRAVLDGLRAEAERCRKGLEEIVRQEAAQASRVESGQKQLAEVRDDLKSLDEELARDRQAWADHPITGELAEKAVEPRSEWFASQLESNREGLETVGREEGAYREALRRQEAARQAADKARQAQAQAGEAAAAAALAHQQAAQAARAAAGKGAEGEKRLADLLDELDAPFPDKKWRETWRRDPAAFLAARRMEAEAWTARSKERVELEGRRAALDIELKALTQAGGTAAEALKRARESFAAIDAGCREKQQQRRSLFEGCPVGEVELALNRAVEDLQKAQAERQEAARQAAMGDGRALEALRQTKAQQEKRQADLARVQADLAGWMADFNARQGSQLDAEELRRLLAHAAEWIAAERSALQALETAIDTARAVLNERQAAREARERTRPTPESADTQREALAGIAAELEAARAKATAIGIELGKDDERRTRSAALLGDIERQEAKARVWAQLNELIGSADGKRFRNFAQQLTLDVLLGYANRHLERLSRRYRLERIEDSLALLVVDQDMGGEIRSVHSLSGGESFLLSLALALGLASLSSHQVRVESLFIDEGFGSLDAEALRVAMEALDSLQAQGRKVGVISHVQEMTERIGTRIQVRRLAGGESRLAITD